MSMTSSRHQVARGRRRAARRAVEKSQEGRGEQIGAGRRRMFGHRFTGSSISDK
jgi:hypothetical protein